MNIPRSCLSLEKQIKFSGFKEHIEEQRQIKGLRAIIVAVAKDYETG